MDINYIPPPTGKKFMESDAKMRVIMGPVGSGKSILSCFEVVRRASLQEPNEQGIRRTRAAVVRETARQLQDTTIKSWLDWFPAGVCGTFMKTTKTYFFKVGDVECEVMFRALDDADDVANLNSLELTFAWFNECRDIHPDIVDAMSKRVGRYPSAKDGGPTWHGMWGDTNPPTMDTWWYYQMEGIDPEDGVSPNNNGWAVFKQPSGRSPEAENIANLPDGYYDTQGRSDDYIRVYIDGEYGLSSAGSPIYKYFRPDYHIAKQTLRPIINGTRPIIIGVDLGLTPAAVLGQLDPRGRALILAECIAFDMGIQRFIRTMLKPLLFSRFAGMPVHVVVDPAGVQRAQTDERSAVDIIKAEGLRVMPARTNTISARISAVDEYLMRQVDGDAGFLMDPSCTRLKAAMMGGYRFKPRQAGVIDKNQHSHCFVAGTLVATPDGMVPIEEISTGDMVCTPFGAQAVTATMSREASELVHVQLENGTTIDCTADHPFYTERGIVLAEDLQYTDILYSFGEQPCQCENGPSKSSMGNGTTANLRGITKPTLLTAAGTYTKTFGSFITARFQTVCAFITRTMTGTTTALATSNCSVHQNTPSITWRIGQDTMLIGSDPGWRKRESPLLSGTGSMLGQRQEQRSCLHKERQAGQTESACSTTAPIAEVLLRGFVEQISADIAAQRARQQRGLPAEWMTKPASALYAEMVSGLIDTGKLRHVPRIVGVHTKQQSPTRVYDLTVGQAHSFYANGVWVSNCAEALQYLMLHISGIASGVAVNQRREVVGVAAAGWT